MSELGLIEFEAGRLAYPPLVPEGVFAGLPEATFTVDGKQSLELLGYDYVVKAEIDSLDKLLEAYQYADISVLTEQISTNSPPVYVPLTEQFVQKLPNEIAIGLEYAVKSDPDYFPIKKGSPILDPSLRQKMQLRDEELLPVVGKLSDYLELDLVHRAETGEPLYRDPNKFIFTLSANDPDEIFVLGYDQKTDGIKITTCSVSYRLNGVYISPIIMPNQGRRDGASIYPRGPYS